MIETLKELGVRQDLIDSMISVGNKIDKTQDLDQILSKVKDENIQLISCETGEGVENLIKKIDSNVIEKSGAKIRKLKLKHDSLALPYLYKNNFISPHNPPKPTEGGNYLLVDVLMNDDQFATFRAHMPNKISKKKN